MGKKRLPQPTDAQSILWARQLTWIQRCEDQGTPSWANDGNVHRSLLARGFIVELGDQFHCRVTAEGRDFIRTTNADETARAVRFWEARQRQLDAMSDRERYGIRGKE